jgi:hypothetical protein
MVLRKGVGLDSEQVKERKIEQQENRRPDKV